MKQPTTNEMIQALGSFAQQSDILKNTKSIRKNIQDWPQELYGIIASQNILRQKASQKFSMADQMLFTQKSLEQATSETIAKSLSTLIKPVDHTIEICSGIGGNTIGLQDVSKKITCIDSDALLSQFHKHNLSLYPSNCQIQYNTQLAENCDLTDGDILFGDPDRRDKNNQRLSLDSFNPHLDFFINLAEKTPTILKMSPLWDTPSIPKPFLPMFISEQNELKQCLWYHPEALLKNISMLLLHQGKTYNDDDFNNTQSQSLSQNKIYVANPAILKSDFGRAKIGDLNLTSLSPNPRFYKGDLKNESPFFESYKILNQETYDLKILKRIIKESDNVRFECRGDKDSIQEASTLIKKASQLSGETLTIFLFKSKTHKQIYVTKQAIAQ